MNPMTTIQARTMLKDEETVISNTLANPSEWENVRHLKISDFSTIEYREIWAAMRQASLDPYGINPLAVSSINPQITSERIQQLIGKANNSTAATNAAAYRISSTQRARRTAQILKDGAAEIDKALENPENTETWRRALSTTIRNATHDISDNKTVGNAELEAELLREVNAPPEYILTGIKSLDQWLINGLGPGKVLGIAAETKVGKTVMAATISYNLDNAENPTPHLLFSTERSKKEIGRLKLARRAGVCASKLSQLTEKEKKELSQKQTIIDTSFIVHKSLATIADIEAEVRYQVEVNNIKLLILDQFQLIGADPTIKGTREQQMTRISQEILRMTDALGISTIVMIQMDEYNNISDHGEPIQRAAHAVLQIRRDINSREGYFQTRASCLGSEENIGSIDDPSLILEKAGPHFATYEKSDRQYR